MDTMKAVAGPATTWRPATNAPGAEQQRPRGRSAETRPTAQAATDSRAARWGLAAILLLLGYEWLVSGLDKLLSAEYRSGLAGELRDTMADNPNHWYVRFLTDVAIPHARAFAALVEWSEVLVALGLFLGAALWIGGDRIGRLWRQRLRLAVVGALLGSALMTTNYYFMAGNRLPWLKTGAPFDEGIDIDGLMTLVALALCAVHLFAFRGGDRASEVSNDRRPS
jgi:thiosulfate dehydrogenase (quinone) large subunit